MVEVEKCAGLICHPECNEESRFKTPYFVRGDSRARQSCTSQFSKQFYLWALKYLAFVLVWSLTAMSESSSIRVSPKR